MKIKEVEVSKRTLEIAWETLSDKYKTVRDLNSITRKEIEQQQEYIVELFANNEKAEIIRYNTEREHTLSRKLYVNTKKEIELQQAKREILELWQEIEKEELKPYYFTYGSDEKYPYTRGEYVVVMAKDIRDAAEKYKSKYPNTDDESVLNCADYYDQSLWDDILQQGFYAGTQPAEVIS